MWEAMCILPWTSCVTSAKSLCLVKLRLFPGKTVTQETWSVPVSKCPEHTGTWQHPGLSVATGPPLAQGQGRQGASGSRLHPLANRNGHTNTPASPPPRQTTAPRVPTPPGLSVEGRPGCLLRKPAHEHAFSCFPSSPHNTMP